MQAIYASYASYASHTIQTPIQGRAGHRGQRRLLFGILCMTLYKCGSEGLLVTPYSDMTASDKTGDIWRSQSTPFKLPLWQAQRYTDGIQARHPSSGSWDMKTP